MTTPAPPDTPRFNLVDRFAPAPLVPFCRLARLDRPIGTWLLLWPGLWGLAAAAPDAWPAPRLIILFILGALVMRSAGCVWNDITDRDIDAHVARTRARPLPSGAVSVRAAYIFCAVLCALGAAILFNLNNTAILLGFAILPIIALYPFMKRWTNWPQICLGIAFSYGALMGFAAEAGHLTLSAFLIYAAAILWTLGYDTIYALQDAEDDALIGIRSTARAFGRHVKFWLWGFYAGTTLLLLAAGATLAVGASYYVLTALAGAHLASQIIRLKPEETASSLRMFRANRQTGAIILAAFLFSNI